MRFLLLAFCGMLSASEYSTIKDSMQSFREQQLLNIFTISKQNKAIVEQNSDYYSEISKKATLYYQRYLTKKWGDDVKLSTKKTFVEYEKGLNQRQSIDFENGVVTIEVVGDEVVKPEYFEKKVQELQNQSVSDAIKKDPVASFVVQDDINDTQKYLDGFLQYNGIVQEDIKQKKVVIDNETKYISSVEIKMVPEHLAKRAEFIKPVVMKKAKEYGVKPSAIFATIETESSFNPLAKSDVPAYGLMQIVPTTGGLDAYYALTNEKKILSPAYLYNPQQNVTIGTKYMQIIRERYLKGVKDELSKFYCSSTAYNAGIGSLYRSFTGKKHESFKAVGIINKMTPDEVYEHLRGSKLLTKEAREYVKHIRARAKNYEIWDSEI
ncbi:MAG: DUF3393 domain-containing protein [Campylobacterales bacterium]|nr:DUF3393 domain-containing protein [Campylobacterales bacterium]